MSLLTDDLRNAVCSGRALLVVGAGVSIGATEGAKTWLQLIEDGIDHCLEVIPRHLPDRFKERLSEDLDTGDLDELLAVAERVETKLKKHQEFKPWLRRLFEDLQPLKEKRATVDALFALGLPIATTNYDSVLEYASGRTPITWRNRDALEQWAQGTNTNSTILHLHGHWEDPESIILGIRSYENLLADSFNQHMLRVLRTLNHFIYVGFGDGLHDPNFSALLAWARDVLRGSPNRHFRLVRKIERDLVAGQHPPGDRIFAVSYGVDYPDLPGFLSKLRPDSAVAEPAPAPVQPPRGDAYDPGRSYVRIPYHRKGEKVVGRATALTRLREHFENRAVSPRGRTALLTGIGGLGKTQLAVEYCYAYADRYAGGVYWLNAADDLDGQLARLAEDARWIHPDSTSEQKIAVARHQLSTRSNALIVFDDVDGVATIESLLPEPPTMPDLLLTSKTEHEGFNIFRVDELDWDDAMRLLESESERVIAGTADEADGVRIIERLERLPLAIELVGAFLRKTPSVSVATYAADLNAQPVATDVVRSRGFASFTKHHANLRKTLEISEAAYRGEPLLRSVLDVMVMSAGAAIGNEFLATLLGVAPGDLQLASALDLATSLRIIKQERSGGHQGDETRWRIHGLVREVYVPSEQARTDAFLTAAARRAARWFRERRWRYSNLRAYEAELDHLKVWRAAVADADVELEAELLWLEAYPPYHRGEYREAMRMLEAAIARAEMRRARPRLRADMLSDLAALTGGFDDYSKSLVLAQEAFALRKESNASNEELARAMTLIAHVLKVLGRPIEALMFAEEALDFHEQHPADVSARCSLLEGIAGMHSDLEDFDAADTYGRHALALARDHDLPEEEVSALTTLSNLERRRGEPARGVEVGTIAVQKAEEIYGPLHPKTTEAMDALAGACFSVGRHHDALAWQTRAYSAALTTFGSDTSPTALIQMRLADAQAQNGRIDEAKNNATRALQALQARCGDLDAGTLSAHTILARVLAKAGDSDGARKQYKIALEGRIARRGADTVIVAQTLETIAWFLVSIGEARRAYELVHNHRMRLRRRSAAAQQLAELERQLQRSRRNPRL